MTTTTPLPVRRRRLVCYLGGPYRDKRGPHYIVEKCYNARVITARLWQMGFAPLSPHLNTYLLDGLEGVADDTFLQADLDMIERCDLFIAMPGWDRSEGTKGELAHAKACGLPCFFWETDQEALAKLAKSQLDLDPAPFTRPGVLPLDWAAATGAPRPVG